MLISGRRDERADCDSVTWCLDEPDKPTDHDRHGSYGNRCNDYEKIHSHESVIVNTGVVSAIDAIPYFSIRANQGWFQRFVFGRTTS